MNILAQLRQRFSVALAQLSEDAADLVSLVLPSQDAKFGDYQANCAMPLGKRLGKPPREVAASLVELLDVADICEPPEIAGPGFINLRLRDDWLAEQVAIAVADTRRLGIAEVDSPRTMVIDYSGPNVAKPMHVGHIRSTVIGDALYRVLRFQGHRVISDNHIGDWGTQFGMIIYGYKNFLDVEALREHPVGELSRLYKLVNGLVEYHAVKNKGIPAAQEKIADVEERISDLGDATLPEDPKQAKQSAKKLRQAEGQLSDAKKALSALREKVAAVDGDSARASLAVEHADIGQAVLQETAKLHAGDKTNRSLWKDILPACLEEIGATYDRLGVTFNHSLGESFYHDRLAGVVEGLTEQGLATESDGAQCVFLDGIKAPMIVQKRDGAYLYATTDLATVQYRMETWQPDAILYVVDHRQSQHFEQLFAAVRLWALKDIGKDGGENTELQHVSFGTVLGEDGRPYKTRTGTAVGLMGLLDEAVDRALAIVSENDDARSTPLLDEAARQEVAERIGIGAIKYADLVHNRTSDYIFSYDKMLAMTGNTAAYMQYSYARVRSIFAKMQKCGINVDALRSSGATVQIGTPAERALVIALLQMGEALDRVVADYRPNHLTAYLFDLASAYSHFFENCPVLKAEDEDLRSSRLLLCDLTARTIQTGLALLGIDVVERM